MYEELDGWDVSVSAARSEDELPATVRAYLRRVEDFVGVPVAIVSIGAEREATIVRREVFAP